MESRVSNALLLLLAVLGVELNPTVYALHLELLDKAIQFQLGYSNSLAFFTEEKDKSKNTVHTVHHTHVLDERLPHQILSSTHNTLKFRWKTNAPDERGLTYFLSQGESINGGPTSRTVNVSFSIARQGEVPRRLTEFTVRIHCLVPTSVPERFAFNILMRAPHSERIFTVVSLQKKCSTSGVPLPTDEPTQLIPIERPPCKRLCKKPNARKLKRILCAEDWAMFATFQHSAPTIGEYKQTLHFTTVQTWFKWPDGYFRKSTKRHSNATVAVSASLSQCNCVKNLKARKKYALIGVGEFRAGDLSALSIVAHQSLLLRKSKVRQQLRKLNCRSVLRN